MHLRILLRYIFFLKKKGVNPFIDHIHMFKQYSLRTELNPQNKKLQKIKKEKKVLSKLYKI